jgi:hypothetical protein
MNCPHCGKRISRKQFAADLGRRKSEAKANAARENGKKGGRPRNDHCATCLSQIKSVRLCLICLTSHQIELYSNRRCRKVECTDDWHLAG